MVTSVIIVCIINLSFLMKKLVRTLVYLIAISRLAILFIKSAVLHCERCFVCIRVI